ncbi:heavy metal transporter [Streptacidiphilus cavernicola]|uniref:Heavy metal transporter n=1 Tax=Streptacidiphilus cavernicola TaxID=3342716 RepID=A0ABV6VUJ7_9ACTN
MSLKSIMDSAETSPVRSRRRRWMGCLLPFLLVVGLLTAGGLYLNRHRDLLPIPALSEGCEVDTSDGIVDLSVTQMGNAGTISAVAISRDLPERAVAISLATAMQESRLENLPAGDRDSIGLFQQRPSQGWGTPAQIADPVYATGKFLDKLVRIPGYAQLPLTVAAQDVQHSGYPDAYAQHEDDATTLAGALTGRLPATLNCTVNGVGTAAAGAVSSDGLQPGAATVARTLTKDFGRSVTPVAAAPLPAATGSAAASGPGSASASAAARGLDLAVGTGGGAAGKQLGWAVAQWAVANCQQLHITAVSYAGRTWQSGSVSAKGWQPTAAGAATAASATSVRITVAG